MKVKLKSKPSVVIKSSQNSPGPPQDLPLNPGRPQGELQQESSQGPAPAVSAPLLHPAHGRSVGLELGPLIVGLQGESVQGGASRILVIVNQNSKNLVGKMGCKFYCSYDLSRGHDSFFVTHLSFYLQNFNQMELPNKFI